LILVLLILFVAISVRRPQLAPLFPVLAAAAELLLLPLLKWRAPAGYFYLNTSADHWLIASSLAATMFLAACCWVSHPRSIAGDQ
jgi:hypothetical protein